MNESKPKLFELFLYFKEYLQLYFVIFVTQVYGIHDFDFKTKLAATNILKK